MAVFVNIIAFYEAESVGIFFSTPIDIINSLIVIILFIGIVWLPIWMFKNIYKNRNDLRNPEFQEKFAWLFEDLRATTLDTALFQFFFVTRRLYYAIILTFLADAVVLQVCSFILLSVI